LRTLRRLVVVPSQPAISKLSSVPVVKSLNVNALLSANSRAGSDIATFVSGLEKNANNQTFMFGLDLSDRTCGNVTTLANTAYVFVAVKADTVLSMSLNLSLQGGRDSMVSVSKANVCVYSATRAAKPASPADATIDKLKSCFPSSALVQLATGETRRMDRLAIGDVVKTSPSTFSPVFLWTHRDATAVVPDFVSLTTASGHVLKLSPGHYLPIPSAGGRLKAAHSVVVGDQLTLDDGAVSAVVAIESVKETGLWNPQTADGSIVVNGVVASTFTTAVHPAVGSALLAAPGALFCAAPRVFSFVAEFVSSIADLTSVRRVVSSILPRGAAW
jgi:Hint module